MRKKLAAEEDEMKLYLLRKTRARLEHVQKMDMQVPSKAAVRCTSLASSLSVSVDLMIQLCSRCDKLVAMREEEACSRVEYLARELGLTLEELLKLLVKDLNSKVLLLPRDKVRDRLSGLKGVFGGRGVPLVPALRLRLDLLLQSPASVQAKLSALPQVLALSPRKVRDIVIRCPQLLRRSTQSIKDRYEMLQSLCTVPTSFIAELIYQEPEVLCFSPLTLKSKFDSLCAKYGSFQDDVVDMILVEPTLLIKAGQRMGVDHQHQLEGTRRKGVVGFRAQQFGQGVTLAAARGDMKRAEKPSVLAPIKRFSQATGLSVEQVIQLWGRDPELSTADPRELNSRVEAAAEALQTSKATFLDLFLEQPSIIHNFSASTISTLADILATALGITQPEAMEIVRQSPQLVLQPEEAAVKLLDSLFEVLGLRGAGLGQLLLKRPGLLQISSEELQARFEGLRGLLDKPPALVRELLRREPALLELPTGVLLERFEKVAGSFGSFRSDAVDIILADTSALLRVST